MVQDNRRKANEVIIEIVDEVNDGNSLYVNLVSISMVQIGNLLNAIDDIVGMSKETW